MKISRNYLANVLAHFVLVFGIMLTIVERTHGQSPCRKKVRDALELSVAEHQKFVSYRVECSVTGYLESSGKVVFKKYVGRNNARCKIYFEHSRVDQHYVTAIKSLEQADAPWLIYGWSRDIGFATSEPDPTTLELRQSKSFMRYLQSDRETPILFFDPTGVGLGFCGDFYLRSTNTLLANRLISDEICDLKEENGLLTWTTGLFKNDPRLVPKGTSVKNVDPSGGVDDRFTHQITTIDTKRSYWTVKMDHYFDAGDAKDDVRDQIHWNVELDKFKEWDIPKVGELRCRENGKETRTRIEYDWKEINEPIEPGLASARRIAEMFQLKLQE